eukprot:6740393-Prymnesium_polylepis.2
MANVQELVQFSREPERPQHVAARHGTVCGAKGSVRDGELRRQEHRLLGGIVACGRRREHTWRPRVREPNDDRRRRQLDPLRRDVDVRVCRRRAVTKVDKPAEDELPEPALDVCSGRHLDGIDHVVGERPGLIEHDLDDVERERVAGDQVGERVRSMVREWRRCRHPCWLMGERQVKGTRARV